MGRGNTVALSAFSLAAAIVHVDGFSTPSRFAAPNGRSVALLSPRQQQQQLRMSSDDKKGVVPVIANFDQDSGTFVDSSGADCVPEDEYCIVDKSSGNLIRLTVEEKERIFLDSLQSYYATGRELLSDGEFDLLKEDLAWNGSPVVALNRKETKYLAAMQAYLKGEPMISDDEFDTLKRELKDESSPIAVSKEPKCLIDTGICTVTWQEDFFRSNLLYLPAVAVLAFLWLGLGFELIAPIARLNPIVLLVLGSPLIFFGAKTITEDFLFQDKFIVYGPCPSCEFENRVYFGDILGVEGFKDVSQVKCRNCSQQFSVLKSTLRASTLPKQDD